MLKQYYLLSSLLILCQPIVAQNMADLVVKRELRNIGEVIHSGQVRGYYYFSILEKKDKNLNSYELYLLDENIQPVNSVIITRPTSFVLVESAYNEKNFTFLFYDKDYRRLEAIAYDSALKQVANFTREVRSPVALQRFKAIALGAKPAQEYLAPLKESGFVYYGFREGRDAYYAITCFDNNLAPIWTTVAPDEKHYNQVLASEAFQTDQYIGSLIIKTKGVAVDYDLLVQDKTTGKEVFKTLLVRNSVALSPMNFQYDSIGQKVIVFGEWYDKDDKELKKQAKGFAYFVLGMDGQITTAKVLPWSYLSRVAPIKENGKTDGSNAFIYFHDFVRTADGRTFAIGEQYKKVFNGAGLAVAALTLGRAYTTNFHINVYNMVIFQFSPEYELEKVHFFEKKTSTTMLPIGATTTTAKLLAHYVKAVGGFDYAFENQSKDKETFTATYVDFDRTLGGALQIGAITYTPEKTFATDKITLAARERLVKVLRAKPGYIYIVSYLRGKDKTLDFRLEKINY